MEGATVININIEKLVEKIEISGADWEKGMEEQIKGVLLKVLNGANAMANYDYIDFDVFMEKAIQQLSEEELRELCKDFEEVMKKTKAPYTTQSIGAGQVSVDINTRKYFDMGIRAVLALPKYQGLAQCFWQLRHSRI